MLDGFLMMAVLTLLHATVLAALTGLLGGRLLRRASPALQAAVWTIVLLKFLVPPVFPGELALSGWLSGIWTLQKAAPAAGVLAGPAAAASLAALPESAAPDSGWGLAGVAAALWAAGVLLLGGRFALAALRERRRWRRLPEASPAVLSEVRRWCARMGIRRIPRVVSGPEGTSPFVAGLFSATLVAPESLLRRLDRTARQAWILHELAHVRRGDLLVRALQNLTRILLFFWPPAWWVCRRIERAAEMACDQWAVSISRIEPHVYAGSLLEVVKSITACGKVRSQLAFAREGRLLEERFEMILNENIGASPKLSWLSFPILALFAAFSLAGGSSGQATEKAPPQEKTKKRVVVVTSGPQGETQIRYPEDADVDGDGVVSEEEDRAFAEKHPELESRFLFVGSGSEGSSFKVQWRPDLSELHKNHPEADANQDGELTQEEADAYLQKKGNSYYFVTDGSDSKAMTIRVGEGTEAIDEFRDADLNGDGRLDEEEIIQLKQRLAGQGQALHVEGGGEVQVIGGDGGVWHVKRSTAEGGEGEQFAYQFEVEPGEGKQKVVVRVSEEGSEPRVIVVNKVRSGEDIHGLSEAEALARGEEMAQGRREQLLKRYPEADLDGDGVISPEEAEALAAKLQKKAKQSEKTPGEKKP